MPEREKIGWRTKGFLRMVTSHRDDSDQKLTVSLKDKRWPARCPSLVCRSAWRSGNKESLETRVGFRHPLFFGFPMPA
jgi:hypothetical protein